MIHKGSRIVNDGEYQNGLHMTVAKLYNVG